MHEPSHGTQRAHLERVIGIPGVAFAAFNGIVGMGIFALPGLVAGILGASAIFAYLLCLLVVALVGLCMAEAGSRVQASGGLYAYASAAFGPVVGGVAGALMVTANTIVGAAAVTRFLLDTLATLWPVLTAPLAGFGLVSAGYAALVLVNVHGARDGSRLNVAMSLCKLVPLVLLVIAGLMVMRPGALAMHVMPHAGPLGQAALLLLFAFQGVETGTYVSGETRDPARTIPRAILLALGLVAALYIGLQTAAQGVLGQSLANAHAPLVDLARAVFGPWGQYLLTVATLLSVGGYLVSDLLCSPRVVYALAAAGQLPRVLARIHPRHHTALDCTGDLSDRGAAGDGHGHLSPDRDPGFGGNAGALHDHLPRRPAPARQGHCPGRNAFRHPRRRAGAACRQRGLSVAAGDAELAGNGADRRFRRDFSADLWAARTR